MCQPSGRGTCASPGSGYKAPATEHPPAQAQSIPQRRHRASPCTGTEHPPAQATEHPPAQAQSIPQRRHRASPCTGTEHPPAQAQSIPLHRQQSIPLHRQQSIPLHRHRASPCTGNRASPCTGNRASPCTGTEHPPAQAQSIPLHRQQSIPLHRQQSIPQRRHRTSPCTGTEHPPAQAQNIPLHRHRASPSAGTEHPPRASPSTGTEHPPAQTQSIPQRRHRASRSSKERAPAAGEMFYSGILTEPSRKEVELREAASLRQQRRMKQAVQFIHKDSADLLPLDGLKKLGTSKDTQPHNILQKRLMETNLSKLRGSRGTWAPKGDLSSQTNKLNQTKLGSSGKTEDEELIVVSCQCAGKELKAVVDTGSQHNLMSSACLDRLGLKEQLKALPAEEEMVSLPNKVKAIGQVECLSLTVGAVPVECAALVVEDNDQPFSFGLQTLKSLKCIINMEKHHLVLGQMDREEIPFVGVGSAEAGEHFSSLEA
ncbi:nuclear receptor-interacting protein 3 isoform X4 [Lonchura striata]